MEKGAYVSGGSVAIDTMRDVWIHDSTELEVVMTAPKQPGSYPLIIYLPSLGEDASAGRLWRETWAKAGYAVFSMQPVAIGQALKELSPQRGGGHRGDSSKSESSDEDSQEPADDSGNWFSKSKPKRSQDGRSSELRYLGHEYFAIDSLKNRMEQLFWAYRQLKTRAGLGIPLLSEADFSKVILVGFDLGAQTVAAVLGEDFKASLPSDHELKPFAAIVLSPSIDLAEGNVRNRFQKLNLPMLVITGSEDNDPYAISSASVRSAVWEFSPAGNKYLLLLTGGVHKLLAGADMGGGISAGQGGDRESDGRGQSGSDGGGRRLQSANQYGGGHGHSQGGNGFGGLGGGKSNGERKNSDLGYKQVAAVFSTTTAFLDAVVKNDEFAQFWINDKANIWLDRAGLLKVR